METNIKITREKRGYTQQECADILGLKLRTFQTYEQGVSEPKMEMLCKMADIFGVSVDYLLGRESLVSAEDTKMSQVKQHIASIEEQICVIEEQLNMIKDIMGN